jgi:hypothetical protein
MVLDARFWRLNDLQVSYSSYIIRVWSCIYNFLLFLCVCALVKS